MLGDGELSKPLTIKAAKFSGSAMEKISAAGGQAEEIAGKAKWTRKGHKEMVAALLEKGLDYKKEVAKKKEAAAKRKAADRAAAK